MSIERNEAHSITTDGSSIKDFAQQAWSRTGQELNRGLRNNQADGSLPHLSIDGHQHNGHWQNASSDSAKDRLLKNLDESFDKDLSKALKGYLSSFEERAVANQVGKHEVAETYRQINRILSATGDKPLTKEQRKQVVGETLRHCADPEVISQGQHNTCNVTAVQVRAYSLHPSKAARLIADVATKGEYTTPTGIHVKLDEQSMEPDKEARISQPDKGKRDYATQLFNLAAVNVWYGAAKPEWHYEQRIEKNEKTHKEHVREQIVDRSGGKEKPVLYPASKKPLDGPTLGADQIAFINDAIVGKHEPCAVLAWGPSSAILPGEKAQPVHAKDIIEESRFQSILQDLKHRHQLPTIAAVETGVYPLNVDSGAAVYGYENGGHVVNITDFSSGKKPHVSIDNEWSAKEDHPNNSVSVHDMYLCIGGSNMARFDAVCDKMAAETNHTVAPVAEMTIIAKDAESGVDAQYARDAGQKVVALAASEKALIGEERSKWFSELSAVVGSTRPEDKASLLGKIQSSAACTQMELGWLVAAAAKSISYQKKIACRTNDADRQRVCTKATTQIAEFIVALPGEAKKHYFTKLREND